MTKFEVTQEDIKGGIMGDSFHCPMASAISRLLKTKVGVGKFVIDIETNRIYGKSSEKMLKAIYDYDATNEMDPGIYEYDETVNVYKE